MPPFDFKKEPVNFPKEVFLPEEDSLVIGVNAVAHAAEQIAGVRGFNRKSGPGVSGVSDAGEGVIGSGGKNGVYGQSKAAGHSGVWGENLGQGFGVAGTCEQGIGVFGSGGTLAAQFEGKVTISGGLEVTGDIETHDVVLTVGGDCAEDFDVVPDVTVEPGTVMVINEFGALQESCQAYDKRVAGVISGAGDYKPGILLDKQRSRENRMPVALLGKVYCKVDAQWAPIQVGDLLTTSPTPGHAMRASDPTQAFGSVIGKALSPIPRGQGLIAILVALQ